jgi:hypothetical protein
MLGFHLSSKDTTKTQEFIMPYIALRQDPEGNWIYPVESMLSKLRRYLGMLVPYRQLWYNKATGGYYVKAIDTIMSGTKVIMHGPYYFKHMVALGRMVNVWHGTDRDKSSITLYDNHGRKYPEEPLPKHLRFAVVTPALAAMVAQLRGEGWTVTPPQDNTAPITAPVTEPSDEDIDLAAIEDLMRGDGETGPAR